jgi:hypothetical protein
MLWFVIGMGLFATDCYRQRSCVNDNPRRSAHPCFYELCGLRFAVIPRAKISVIV